MVYCISDIHGKLGRWRLMLDLIQLRPEDELYVLGDVIDRGPSGIAILEEIMSMDNVHMLRGNHEQMMLDAIYFHEFGAYRLWEQNGGIVTDEEFCQKSRSDQEKILEFLNQLPSVLDRKINDTQYHFVHGQWGDFEEDRLWRRPKIDDKIPVLSETEKVVIGHTPTPFFTGKTDELFHIVYGPQYIAIDCGCGTGHPMKRLGCLRLDDLKEFYV